MLKRPISLERKKQLGGKIMMKKIMPVLLAMVLVLGLVMLGCGKNDDGNENGNENPGDNNTSDTRTVELGDFTASNNDNQKGWGSNGTDDKETNLAIEDLKAAKYLVLELSKAPSGGLQVIWQGDGNAWDWAQNDEILSDTGSPNAAKGASLSGNVLKIELSKALKDYSKLAASTKAKIFIAYYSPDAAGLGITRAYLIIE
jgi:uncharacterized protein YxeA